MTVFAERLKTVRAAMKAQGLDALVITPGAAMRYLAGFSTEGHERLIALIAPAIGEPVIIAPALNAEQMRGNPAGFGDIRAWGDTEGWAPALRRALEELGSAKAIGVDEQMPARFLLGMQEIAPSAAFRNAGPILAGARIAKDGAEIAAMHRAASVTDGAIAAAFPACRPGATELDVQLAIEAAIYAEGGELSFAPIVGAGAHSALPHHHTGASRIANGDVVVLDFGARMDGYCGDITRTVAVGEAPTEAKKVYEIVYAAHHAALAAAREGVSAESVDAAARDVIERAGYGEYFIHRTGHGIGLEEHELPNIVAGNTTLLRPGMCFSIEPGIYLPGRFGVRLENIVTIDHDGSSRALDEPIPAAIPIVGAP